MKTIDILTLSLWETFPKSRGKKIFCIKNQCVFHARSTLDDTYHTLNVNQLTLSVNFAKGSLP